MNMHKDKKAFQSFLKPYESCKDTTFQKRNIFFINNLIQKQKKKIMVIFHIQNQVQILILTLMKKKQKEKNQKSSKEN